MNRSVSSSRSAASRRAAPAYRQSVAEHGRVAGRGSSSGAWSWPGGQVAGRWAGGDQRGVGAERFDHGPQVPAAAQLDLRHAPTYADGLPGQPGLVAIVAWASMTAGPVQGVGSCPELRADRAAGRRPTCPKPCAVSWADTSSGVGQVSHGLAVASRGDRRDLVGAAWPCWSRRPGHVVGDQSVPGAQRSQLGQGLADGRWVEVHGDAERATTAGLAGSKPLPHSWAASSPRRNRLGRRRCRPGLVSRPGLPARASIPGWRGGRLRRHAGWPALRRYAKESSPAPRITYCVMPLVAAAASRSSVYRLRQVAWARAADSTGCSPCAR